MYLPHPAGSALREQTARRAAGGFGRPANPANPASFLWAREGSGNKDRRPRVSTSVQSSTELCVCRSMKPAHCHACGRMGRQAWAALDEHVGRDSAGEAAPGTRTARCEGTNQGLVLKEAEKPAKLRSGRTGPHTGSGTQERQDGIMSAPGMRPAEHTCVSTTSGPCSHAQRDPKMTHSSDPVLFRFPDASPAPTFSSPAEGRTSAPAALYPCSFRFHSVSPFRLPVHSGGFAQYTDSARVHLAISLAPSHGCPRRHDTQGQACTRFYRNLKLKAFS